MFRVLGMNNFDCVINFFFKKGDALLNIKAMPLTFRPSTFSDKVLVCMPLAFKWQREGTAKEGRVCKYKVAPSSGPPPSSHCSSTQYIYYDSKPVLKWFMGWLSRVTSIIHLISGQTRSARKESKERKCKLLWVLASIDIIVSVTASLPLWEQIYQTFRPTNMLHTFTKFLFGVFHHDFFCNKSAKY